MCGIKGLNIGASIVGPGLGFSTFSVLRGVGEAQGLRGTIVVYGIWFEDMR